MFMAQFSKTNWSREMTCYFGFFSPYVLQCVVQCRLVVWLTGWLAGSLGRMHICELFIWKSPCDMLLNTEYYISFSTCVVLSHLAVLSWIVADEKKKKKHTNQKTDFCYYFYSYARRFIFRFYFRCCVCSSFVVQILSA